MRCLRGPALSGHLGTIDLTTLTDRSTAQRGSGSANMFHDRPREIQREDRLKDHAVEAMILTKRGEIRVGGEGQDRHVLVRTLTRADRFQRLRA